MTEWLERGDWPAGGVPLVADSPVRWVHPTLVRPHDAGHLRVAATSFGSTASSGTAAFGGAGRAGPLDGAKQARLVPNRSVDSVGVGGRVDPLGPAVHVTVTDVR